MSAYRRYLRGKNVVLVGPASTLRGQGLGEFIDSHDVVVRLNHAWPLPEELKPDIGSRIDVIYHNLNPLNQRIRRRHVLRMRQDGTRWMISSHPANRIRYRRRQRRFRLVNKGLLRFRAVPGSLIRRLRRRVGFPNSGMVAIVDLLRFPIQSLHVTGFSFYTTGYDMYPNYRRIPRRLALRNHNQRRHKAYLARLLRRESRLTVDPFIEEILKKRVRKRRK